MQKLKLLLTIVSVSLFSVPANAQEPKDSTMTIAAWNVMGRPEIDDTRAGQIAIGIAYLDAEVIALTEVNPHSMAETIKDKLTELGCEYEYEMPTQEQSELGIAIFYKTNVTKISDAEFIEEAQLGPGDPRRPVTMELKLGNFDFRVVAVHFKSSASGLETRNQQCEKVADFIKARVDQTESEKDVLVIGDYNMIPKPRNSRDDSANYRKLNKHGQFDFISRNYMYLKGSYIRGGSYGNILDGFAVSAGRTEEYIDGSLRIFPLHHTFRLTLRDFADDVSDHLPLVAKFDILVEDDD